MKPCSLCITFNDTRTEVLLIKRRDIPIWVLPGGGIDEGETPEEACIREVLEETGYQIEIKRKIGEYTPTTNFLVSDIHLYEGAVVACSPTESLESKGVGFYPIHSPPGFFFPLHKTLLEDGLLFSPEILQKKIPKVTIWTIIKGVITHPIATFRYFLSKVGLTIQS